MKFVFLLLCLCAYNVISLKILVLFPHSGKSHFMTFENMFRELAYRGHEITVVSDFPQDKSIERYRDIVTEPRGKRRLGSVDFKEKYNEFSFIFKFRKMAFETCEKLYQRPVLDLLRSNETFDLILVEYFNQDCFLGFVHKFKAPVIGFSSCQVLSWHHYRVGKPSNPSYIPVTLGSYNRLQSFADRLENTIVYIYNNILYYLLVDIPANSIANKYFGDDAPCLHKIAENTSLLLVNTFFAYNGAYPMPKNVIEIGGVHLKLTENIPKNIEKWINESAHGVIYFSMGSMIKGDTFPEDKRIIFQKTFARLQQRVIWKWENQTMPGKPDNVMIQKWMPQFDILCHPNVKAFITHGGLLGTTEAVHCGVPAVVMPQFGDQYTNARALEASGGGVVLHFSTITEEDVYNALKTVLDPSFNKKAKELSARFKDRPMSPMDTAIYWVEYVARHKGAPHLRSAAVGMPYYQYLLLDVIAFLVFVSSVTFYILYISIKFILKKLFGKADTKVKKQ